MDNPYLGGYYGGYVDALRDYAWWKDGTQYVGTCGTTLAEAIARVAKAAKAAKAAEFGETEGSGEAEAEDSGIKMP